MNHKVNETVTFIDRKYGDAMTGTITEVVEDDGYGAGPYYRVHVFGDPARLFYCVFEDQIT